VPDASVPAVEFQRVSKTYGATPAVDRLSLSIAPGELFSILGPSGCGKTTTLRLLAGLEVPDPGGRILIHGEDVTARRPYDRRLSMVFQNYALFPHLSVERNVAFGLEQQRVPRSAIPGRVLRALELVRLDPETFAGRMPSQLSGGQRQRVALARALATDAPVLVLHEPTTAVDAATEHRIAAGIRAVRGHRTTVLVTTSPTLLAAADRVVLIDGGRVVATGDHAGLAATDARYREVVLT
jgi:ABC-type Fe3+/spermidine/putrescine transport system ATPase subunit